MPGCRQMFKLSPIRMKKGKNARAHVCARAHTRTRLGDWERKRKTICFGSLGCTIRNIRTRATFLLRTNSISLIVLVLIFNSFQQTCVFSGIQLKQHFIEFVFVETNEVVRSNSDMILTRQTCGQRSSRVAGSKCQALEFYFPIRIWYLFLISMCTAESDLGLCITSPVCMTSVLTRECGCTVPTSDLTTCLAAKFVGSRHCTAAFSLKVLKSCTDLDPTLLYILILKTHTKFVQ